MAVKASLSSAVINSSEEAKCRKQNVETGGSWDVSIFWCDPSKCGQTYADGNKASVVLIGKYFSFITENTTSSSLIAAELKCPLTGGSLWVSIRVHEVILQSGGVFFLSPHQHVCIWCVSSNPFSRPLRHGINSLKSDGGIRPLL